MAVPALQEETKRWKNALEGHLDLLKFIQQYRLENSIPNIEMLLRILVFNIKWDSKISQNGLFRLKVFILPRVAELFIHKEKQRGCPLLGANRYSVFKNFGLR